MCSAIKKYQSTRLDSDDGGMEIDNYKAGSQVSKGRKRDFSLLSQNSSSSSRHVQHWKIIPT
jgi:hypothetical protein